MTMTEATQATRTKLEENIHRRKASLTQHEEAFLHALLVDLPKKEQLARASKVLDDDMLFCIPTNGVPTKPPHRTSRKGKSLALSIGLWRAHEDGVAPSELARMHSAGKAVKEISRPISKRTGLNKSGKEALPEEATEDTDSDLLSIRSDEEVRVEKSEYDSDDISSASSWKLDDGGFEHYDAWEVLKDEYAGDFGFDYGGRKRVSDYENPTGTFQILGTSADDASAQPHVLSPPLMESLLSFVPESLSNENFWLRFSLVRDGAALSTLQRYLRAAPNTILAIETTEGDVFGAFTTSPWTKHRRYYGSDRDTFLWKMRSNRLTPCHSLFEQAHMETEVEVYCYSGLNEYVQLCTNDKLAVGGGQLNPEIEEDSSLRDSLGEGGRFGFGFGIAVDDDLLRGSSSRCATFRSPCLVNHSSQGESFEVVNLEVWSFTPCNSVDEAEKLEMSKFFIQESIRSNSSSIGSSRPGSPNFSSEDFDQHDFYRRIGERDESEQNRDGWQYAIMMTEGGSTMHSPNLGS